MNYIVALISLMLASTAIADVGVEHVRDESKKDEVVKLVDKNGKVTEFNHEDYAIVPRIKRRTVPSVKPCEPPRDVLVEVDRVVEKYRKNTITFLIGLSPNGYDIDGAGPYSLAISNSRGFVGAVLYRRQLDERWGANAGVMTNGSFLLGPSYSW